jgi:hypothetical protein
LPGKYRVALDSDAREFGGHGRVRSPILSVIRYYNLGWKMEIHLAKGGIPHPFYQKYLEIAINS